MPVEITEENPAPVGKNLHELSSQLHIASITNTQPPTGRPPVVKIKIKSLSSKNQMVTIGSQQVQFNGDGLGWVDAAHRQEVEHHCNLRQGFFSIVEEESKPPAGVVNNAIGASVITFVADFVEFVKQHCSEEVKLSLIDHDFDSKETVMRILEEMLNFTEPSTSPAVENEPEEVVAAADVGSTDSSEVAAAFNAIPSFPAEPDPADADVEGEEVLTFDAEGNPSVEKKVKRGRGRPKKSE